MSERQFRENQEEYLISVAVSEIIYIEDKLYAATDFNLYGLLKKNILVKPKRSVM